MMLLDKEMLFNAIKGIYMTLEQDIPEDILTARQKEALLAEAGVLEEFCRGVDWARLESSEEGRMEVQSRFASEFDLQKFNSLSQVCFEVNRRIAG